MRQDYFTCYQSALKSNCALRSKIQRLRRLVTCIELHFNEFASFGVSLRSVSRRSYWIDKRLLSSKLWKPYYSILRGKWSLSIIAPPFQDVRNCHQDIHELIKEADELQDQIGKDGRESVISAVCKILHKEISSLLDQTSRSQTQALTTLERHFSSIPEEGRVFLRNFLFVPPGENIFEIVEYRGVTLSQGLITALRVLLSHECEVEGRELTLIHPTPDASPEERLSFLLKLLDFKGEIEKLQSDWNSLISGNGCARKEVS